MLFNGIELDADDYKILMSILSKYSYKFYAYGSRVKDHSRRYSDLDIFCKTKMDSRDMFNLKSDLEDSNITIKVDILDVASCSKKFQETIAEDLVLIS